MLHEVHNGPLKSPTCVSPTVKRRMAFEKRCADAVRNAYLKDCPISQLSEHCVDITTIKREDRGYLLQGGRISVVADGNHVIRKGIPIRALMASSYKLHDLVQVRRPVCRFRVSSKIDQESVIELLDVFTKERVVNFDRINLASGSFARDLLIYQAGYELGIHYAHILPLLNALCWQISARLLTFKELDSIVARVRSTDALFKHLVNDLCYRRFRKRIAETKTFQKWLGRPENRELREMMAEIDQVKKRVREAAKLWSGVYDARRAKSAEEANAEKLKAKVKKDSGQFKMPMIVCWNTSNQKAVG